MSEGNDALGMPAGEMPTEAELLNRGQGPQAHGEADDADESFVPEPAKLMRIGGMVRKLLEEVRHADLDEAGRDRMRDIYLMSLDELSESLNDQLADELQRLALPFEGEGVPSEAELRIAQAQLVGWLEGLFHGIQAAFSAQQMMAERQLRSIRQNALEMGGESAAPADNVRHGVYL